MLTISIIALVLLAGAGTALRKQSHRALAEAEWAVAVCGRYIATVEGPDGHRNWQDFAAFHEQVAIRHARRAWPLKIRHGRHWEGSV